jgi:hypothetical protein
MAINYMYFIRPARKEIHLPPAVLAQMAGNNALSAWGG